MGYILQKKWEDHYFTRLVSKIMILFIRKTYKNLQFPISLTFVPIEIEKYTLTLANIFVLFMRLLTTK